MFAVIFEVRPKSDWWDDYLHHAGLLRPELERIEGFIENIRYRSQRHPGVVLSLSIWRDEKALVRWRTQAMHHDVQRKGRFEVFEDYHLRVGQITADTHLPEGHILREQRLDETETGAAKAISLVDDPAPPPPPAAAPGLVDHDLFNAILTPGRQLLLLSWRQAQDAAGYHPPAGARCRAVRVVRDYGMRERHEAPQYMAALVAG